MLSVRRVYFQVWFVLYLRHRQPYYNTIIKTLIDRKLKNLVNSIPARRRKFRPNRRDLTLFLYLKWITIFWWANRSRRPSNSFEYIDCEEIRLAVIFFQSRTQRFRIMQNKKRFLWRDQSFQWPLDRHRL